MKGIDTAEGKKTEDLETHIVFVTALEIAIDLIQRCFSLLREANKDN